MILIVLTALWPVRLTRLLIAEELRPAQLPAVEVLGTTARA